MQTVGSASNDRRWAPALVILVSLALGGSTRGDTTTYVLRYGPWSTCSVPCGDAGRQTRDAVGLSFCLHTFFSDEDRAKAPPSRDVRVTRVAGSSDPPLAP